MVAPNISSPNVGNYYIGRGIVSIKIVGEHDYVDAGNCTLMEFEVKPTVLPHFSSRVGVQTKDFTAVTRLEATLRATVDEITGRNLGLLLLGSVTDLAGTITVDIFNVPQLFAAFKFQGTNTIGPVWTGEFPLVQLTPQKAISLISAGAGEWGTIELQGDVLNGAAIGQPPFFGTFTATDFVGA